jgi:hypothetical protein
MNTLDHCGYIGRDPDNERLFIVTGDSGQGMTHGATRIEWTSGVQGIRAASGPVGVGRRAAARRPASGSQCHPHSRRSRNVHVFGAAIVTVLHWDQFLALIAGTGASFVVEWKHSPLPPAYVAAVLAGVAAVGILPLAEELLRTWRAASTGAFRARAVS